MIAFVCIFTIYGSLNDDGCRDLNVIKQDVLEKIRQNELHNKLYYDNKTCSYIENSVSDDVMIRNFDITPNTSEIFIPKC